MSKEKLDLLIQEAAKAQEQELRWVSNLYQKRLKELQEMEIERQKWLKSKDCNDKLEA
ncbi:MAG: hypothetical protein ACO3LW_06970 [bacterium]